MKKRLDVHGFYLTNGCVRYLQAPGGPDDTGVTRSHNNPRQPSTSCAGLDEGVVCDREDIARDI